MTQSQPKYYHLLCSLSFSLSIIFTSSLCLSYLVITVSVSGFRVVDKSQFFEKYLFNFLNWHLITIDENKRQAANACELSQPHQIQSLIPFLYELVIQKKKTRLIFFHANVQSYLSFGNPKRISTPLFAVNKTWLWMSIKHKQRFVFHLFKIVDLKYNCASTYHSCFSECRIPAMYF